MYPGGARLSLAHSLAQRGRSGEEGQRRKKRMLRAVLRRVGWEELFCSKRCCHSLEAFSNSNSAPETKQKPRLGRTLSANPISAWKPSLTQSLARRQGDPPSVSPSLPLSRWPDGHPGFLAAPETAGAVPPGALPRTPLHPAPGVPQRSRHPGSRSAAGALIPRGGGHPNSPGHQPAAGQGEGGGPAAEALQPSPHPPGRPAGSPDLPMARSARSPAPAAAALCCALYPIRRSWTAGEEARRPQPLPRRGPAPAL